MEDMANVLVVYNAPLKQVGKTSKDPWITFVKKYSQENGIKYSKA